MLRAVLVDDEEIGLDVLDILLREIGGVSVERKFLLVEEAIAYLREAEADIVFLDIEMPGMNGLAAAEKLRELRPSMKIVFVTAYQEYAVEAFDVDAFGYLLKPVSRPSLEKTLDRYRGRHAQRAEQPAVADTVHAAGDSGSRPGLHLNVLGGMELYDADNRLVTWRTKKTKEMFAFLWHHGGVPVHRDRILDALWPELPLNKAQALFHTTVYQLRSVLKNVGMPETVKFGDERYWMLGENISSDLERLECILKEEERPGNGAVTELLSIYRGDYLEAEGYDWADDRRSRTHGAVLQWLARTARSEEQIDREAVYRKMIALEPYEEAHYRSLLQLLREKGDAAGERALGGLMIQRFKVELGLDFSLD